MLTAALSLALLATLKAGPVKDYAPLFAECRAEECGRRLIVLRSFRQAGERRILTVDPRTLETEARPMKGLHLRRLPVEAVRASTADEPYGRVLLDSETNGASHQDAGIVHALPAGNGVVLTVDLCPSARPLDRRLFEAVIATFLPEERPVPLGIAVTGRWMEKHRDDLAWLRGLQASGEMAVTWINHSYNHRYGKDLPVSRNFLLEPGTDIRKEILSTEALMLENGLTPSIFFRFPGLISDLDLVKRVVSFGLAPIGSDAWLAKTAKDRQPSPGSIVLVHGNGNEPVGVNRFLALLREEGRAIRSRDWLLFDLRDSVRLEEIRKH
ncbi:MAG: polysaccharide deacetylase [Vicinamibacteria bacterium]|nr:polysaccharide deacetylase [Vicinamibacteria bacterium]